MWTHPESPVGQKTEDESSNDEAAADAEAESDSGDSLFITQTAVPEAVRAGRRHRRRQPDSTSSSSESDATLSSSHRKSKKFTMDKETRIKYKKKPLSKSRLPTYSFPFLEGSPQMSRSSMLPVQQNTRLHNSLMGGFFECVREQWQGFLLTSFATSSLPTVDKEGQYIHPLTEDEEERSEDEDFKVVPKKCFVASTKAKRKQTWCNQAKEQSGMRRKAVKARQKTSQKGQKVLPAKASTSWAASLTSDTESDDDEDFSCGVLDERERNDEHVTNDKNCLTQTATPRTSRYLARTARKELCIDSDSTGRELQRSPTASDSQTDVSHTDDLSQTEDEPESTDNDNVCDESTVKEREKDSESVNEEVEETSSLAQDNWAEPSALQATDEVELNERNYAENLSLDDAILIQEEGDTRESIESDVRMEDDGKKRKRSREGDKDVEQLESSTDTKPRNLHGNAEIQEKRKKEIVLPEGCEEEEASNRILDMTPASTGQSEKSGDNPAASEETLESSYSRRTKHQKKQQSSSNGATQDGDDGEDVNFSNDAVTSAESTEVSLTKKKKKKTVSDGQDISDTSVANEMFENLDNTQETTEGPEDENAELMMMKKKTVSDVVDHGSYTSEEDKKLKHRDDTQKAMEGLEDQNAELETPRKRKKKKKSTVSEGEDFSHTLEENENIGDVGNIQKTTGGPKDQNPEPETPKEKKKKKTVSDDVDSCYTSEENKKLKHVDDTQTAIEGFKDQNTELETPRKRKKKKKSTLSDGEDISHTLEENEINDDVGNIQKAIESPKDQNTELETPKKKKKKKKTKTVADEVDISSTCEENEKIEKVDDTQKTSEAPEDENAELQTPKKKKKKKKKTVSDEIDISYTLEENENISDVDNTQKTTKSVEDENADLVTMKKKKKKKIASDEVEPSYTSEENKKLKDVDNIQKMVEEQNTELETAKKKKKKKTVSSEVEICHTSQENEMIENVDTTHKTTEGLEDQSNELVTLKKKKRKKKALSDEVQDIDNTQKTTKGLDDQNAELVAMKKKKKKKVSNGEDVSYTLEENEKVDDTQKGTGGPEDQNAELVTTEKKKKKIGEITSRNISEDSAAQSNDSVSVQKKEKKRTSSFLVADAEENVQTYRGQKSPAQSVDAHVWSAQKPGVSAGGFETESAEITGSLEETNDGVRKKKRKRKMSVEQDSVEKDHKACLHETNNTGVKRKKKRTGNESETVTPMERLENAADEEHRPTDEAAMLKRKKKCKDKPCHVIQDNPPAANEDVESEKSPLNSCSSALHKRKGKDLTSPLVAKEKLNMVAYTSSEQPENKLTDKKKRKSLKGDVLKWSIGSPQFNPQGQRNLKFINVVRSYHGKHMKVKQDLVTD